MASPTGTLRSVPRRVSHQHQMSLCRQRSGHGTIVMKIEQKRGDFLSTAVLQFDEVRDIIFTIVDNI